MFDEAAVAACMAYMQKTAGEDPADDVLVQTLMTAAAEYLKGAGIYRTAETASRYDLCLWGLTLHWYDHRDSVGSELSIPANLRPLMNQLKACGLAGGEA